MISQILSYIGGHKTIATFDNKGKLNGPYQEFYYDPYKKTYSIKIEGGYEIKKYKITHKNNAAGYYYSGTFKIRRAGIWKFY